MRNPWRILSRYAHPSTARNVEVGNFVSASGAALGMTPVSAPGSTGGPPTGGAQGGQLFDVVDLRSMEIFVAVPEQDAPFVQTGQPVDLTFSKLPGQTFTGKVIRSSDSLSQQSRTLLAEVQVKDTQHRLRPGMIASPQMHYRAPNRGILIPGDSLITLARGEFVPVVENNVIQMRPAHVGRDLGTQVYVPHHGRKPSCRRSPTVAFLMKDVVLLAVSFYLVKQDVVRVTAETP